MNLKNLMMWGIIVLLVVGLFQLFQNPNNSVVSNKVPFSEFLKNIEDGRVVQVEIKGNNIEEASHKNTMNKRNEIITILFLFFNQKNSIKRLITRLIKLKNLF